MLTGQHDFEIFKVNLQNQLWSKIDMERPILQTLGSRPVYKIDEATQQFKIYNFAGQVPLQRINAGVKVCPPDMNYFDSRKMKWTRLSEKNPASATIKGRKNFAMSFCADHLFVTGGMDNG